MASRISTVCAALALGCATTAPTPELVEARSAYEQARTGPAGERVPNRVYEAKKALDAAERVHDRDPGSTREADLAYIAHRKALKAMAIAQQEVSRVRIAQAQRREQTVLTAQRNRANERLARMLEEQKQATAEAEQRARAALESLEKIATIRTADREVRISLSGEVLFKSNAADLLPVARERLDEVAEALVEQGDQKAIIVEGHSDSRGSDEYNLTLSQRRADAVREYLVSKGVPSERIRAEGKGEALPIANNDTAEGRANNRRVEIVVRDQAEPGQPEMPAPQRPMQQPEGAPRRETPPPER